ncbi:hypothetical protein ACQP1W_31780 [Spirillospora sp. CA-255316]
MRLPKITSTQVRHWIKFRTVRSWVTGRAVAALMVLLFAVLIGVATVHRYVTEVVDLLAGLAHDLTAVREHGIVRGLTARATAVGGVCAAIHSLLPQP